MILFANPAPQYQILSYRCILSEIMLVLILDTLFLLIVIYTVFSTSRILPPLLIASLLLVLNLLCYLPLKSCCLLVSSNESFIANCSRYHKKIGLDRFIHTFYIENYDANIGISNVRRYYASESFLTRSIPKLKFIRSIILRNNLCKEVNTHSCLDIIFSTSWRSLN